LKQTSTLPKSPVAVEAEAVEEAVVAEATRKLFPRRNLRSSKRKSRRLSLQSRRVDEAEVGAVDEEQPHM